MWSLPQAWDAEDLGSLAVGWLLWWVRMRLFAGTVTGISSSVSSELVNWKKLTGLSVFPQRAPAQGVHQQPK